MKSAMANYWWGSSADNRRMHWMSWERLTKPKNKGGMGFCDFRCFNLAMLGKQGWRLIERPNSLCARVLKGRYFHDTEFMEASRKRHASSTWRAILAGREALQESLFKRVGDGESTNIWRHKWISNHFAGQPITPSNGHQLVNVSELMIENGDWNTELIKNTFLSIDADAILRQPRGRIGQDFWAWNSEKSGIYSVRSAYKLLYSKKVDPNQDQVPGSSSDGLWKKLWKIKVSLQVYFSIIKSEFMLFSLRSIFQVCCPSYNLLKLMIQMIFEYAVQNICFSYAICYA
jgi:hypothetical protein